ncbi:hypothetical protein CEP50_06775 [Actinopolyspora mortivallis]|uniref:Uncharacterized protein n=1 Tax=Actinopolyspora mortivallis TaxID=33906 RepID=A0A2T0GYI5_ACTMO|nr:hypothetical protein CEP50_06775 [Actinopolyspora mortivallis]
MGQWTVRWFPGDDPRGAAVSEFRRVIEVGAHWWEVLRLCRVAGQRPAWQHVAAFVVSVWTLWWIGGQFLVPQAAPSALEIWTNLLERAGITDVSWSDRVVRAWQRAGMVLAVAGGLLWAATTERGQTPALAGWVAVMLASQYLGYQPAVLVALVSLVGLVSVLWLVSLVNGRFVDRYPRLLPADVLRAGVTAAALSAVVPLYAPAIGVFRLLRPYFTQPPRTLSAADAEAVGLSGTSRGPVCAEEVPGRESATTGRWTHGAPEP